MRLPPGPGRCRQRAAADAARFPESFRARRALLETYPDPARLREPPSADRDVPPPARDTCGAWPGVSPYRPPPADRTFRPAQTGYSTRCRQAMLRTADRSHARVRAQKKRDGSPLSTQGAGTKKRDGSPHSAPQGEPDIVTPHPAAVPQFAERFPHKSPVEPELHGSPANLSYKYSQNFGTDTTVGEKYPKIAVLCCMKRERHNDKVVGEVIARLKLLRRNHGLSQMDVYIDTDINIARIESGRGNMSISTLADLCDYYEITLEEFFRMEICPSETCQPEEVTA